MRRAELQLSLPRERDSEDQRPAGLPQITKAGPGLSPSPAQGGDSKRRGMCPREKLGFSLGLDTLLGACLPGCCGDSNNPECGWLERERHRMGERGQHCDPGGPVHLPEEEFEQLHGHQKITPGETPAVGTKVGSEVVMESVPPSCDWRKLKGVKSPIKEQVSTPIWPRPASVARERGVGG